MNRFWNFSKRYVVRYLPWYLVGFAFVFFTQWMAVTIVDQTKNAIDAVNSADAVSQTVMPFVVNIIMLAIGLVVIRTASRLLVFTPGRMIEYHVRNDYYQRLLTLQRSDLDEHESGDLVSRCSNDIGFIRAAYGFGLLQVANVSFTLILVLRAMLAMDARTTLYLAIPMVISFLIIQGSISYLFNYWRLSNEQLGQMSSICLASYKGVSAIQNYSAEAAVQSRFATVNDGFLRTQTIITGTRSFAIPLVQLVGNFSIFLVLFVVGPKVVAGELTIGQITAFLGYIAMVMPPLLSLGWMLNVFNRSIPAMERLDEILLAEPSVPPAKVGTQPPADTAVTVEVTGLNFHFDSTPENPYPFAVKDISFSLPPGKILGIVGPLGCGKTTLLDTTMRLNGLGPGQITIDGFDARDVELDHYRRFFSFAPQQVFLFSTTLRKNLEVSLPPERWDKDNDELLLRYLRFAGFQLDPKQFPQGLETQVGQKGVMLSGGQRQRIALARALLKEAQIYVLDDVLSAVDHDTEKKIIANLREFAAGKSFIIASHRVSAIQWADEILVMNNGSIVARGHHDELIETEGFYREIYEYQSQHGEHS